MTSNKVKILSITVGALALIATPALARKAHKQVAPASEARASAYNAYASAGTGSQRIIGSDRRVVGADPKRDAQLKWALENVIVGIGF